eukprot:Em0011g886a
MTIKTVDASQLCVGNPDEIFKALMLKKTFFSRDGISVVAEMEELMLGYPTIRSSGCEILICIGPAKRCLKCTMHRKSLFAMISQNRAETSTERVMPTSHTNYRYMSAPDLRSRLTLLHKEHCKTTLQLERLRKKVAIYCEEDNGTEVDAETHDDLKSIVVDYSATVVGSYPPDSLERIFWEQQEKTALVKNARSMKWHPLMIRWCLYLRHISGKAYEAMRRSGILKLPTQRTLKDYTYFTSTTIGFSVEVDRQLMDAAKLSSCAEYEKCVILVMDEVHIKEDLVFDKRNGNLLGFTSLGDINDKLMGLEQFVAGEETKDLATSMLVIMVRGLFNRFCFPYAQFATTSLTGDQLIDPIWSAVARLERCGFNVLGITADGASSNRRFFKIHEKQSHLDTKIVNPHAPERSIFFFSDPPHLIKTVRNCWLNRRMWCNGKEILWSHLKELYELENDPAKTVPGMRIVPKLKYEHIHLIPFSKMRVDLAAQVLSESVAKAMELTGGPVVSETVKFITMMDKFFDCLNVDNYSSGYTQRKPFKQPYRSANDFRLNWLEKEFLPYLDQWEQSVLCRDVEGDKGNMLLSNETLLGIRLTVTSFIGLVTYIFTLPGVTSFLSEKINQDPLEKFFGCQRQRGGANDNPTVTEFFLYLYSYTERINPVGWPTFNILIAVRMVGATKSLKADIYQELATTQELSSKVVKTMRPYQRHLGFEGLSRALQHLIC